MTFTVGIRAAEGTLPVRCGIQWHNRFKSAVLISMCLFDVMEPLLTRWKYLLVTVATLLRTLPAISQCCCGKSTVGFLHNLNRLHNSIFSFFVSFSLYIRPYR